VIARGRQRVCRLAAGCRVALAQSENMAQADPDKPGDHRIAISRELVISDMVSATFVSAGKKRSTTLQVCSEHFLEPYSFQ
jgi:hypothetical protein